MRTLARALLASCVLGAHQPAAAQQATLLGPAPEAGAPEAAFPAFGGAWRLTDHLGRPRTQVEPEGRHQLLFFGYATCEAICTVALPVMAEVAGALADRGVRVVPLVVTVDPERDTVAAMGPALAAHAPGLTGLTGSQDALARVRALFHVERRLLFTDPLGRPVWSHGAHVFVLDPEGRFLTLLPPVLSVDAMVDIVAGHAARRG